MIKNLFTPSGEPATYLKKLYEERHSVVFRLTIWYAGIFAACLLATLAAFYFIVLYGSSHGISHHALSELREDFREYFGVPLAIGIALSGAIGWFMAKRALSGVEEMTRAAVDISNGALDRRVPVTGRNDEIDRLAQTFNAMVGHTQALIEQMREITENIAHDLRSPITRMRGLAEMALAGKRTDEEIASTAGLIIEECDRLLDLINTTLDISEAEAGLAKLNRERTDLVELIADLQELFQPSAEERHIELQTSVSRPVFVPCDRRKMQRVFANLLDNALKYTPEGGRVTVLITDTGQNATVIVEDTGTGIPEADLPHIFERFFRGERSRSTPGSGLGLSLAQAFVLIHGGTITAANTPRGGSQLIVTLPGRTS
ncbi:MAG: Alkaline phosphatase synthesis sensor protein PhoR [Syntrophorhabdaceae bacterium PtaU1.Bin034]|nr:MAG: Alkaline phosphatase synthesis sensor protein PhoR [Syntrophorhabdaceae bacterium PtaU1.Bin034]